MKVSRKVTRFGNSLGLTIPKTALSMAGLGEGDPVELEIESQNITIYLRKKSKK
jgi:antitoxin component of MazEF toxin-antitoxin module